MKTLQIKKFLNDSKALIAYNLIGYVMIFLHDCSFKKSLPIIIFATIYGAYTDFTHRSNP